MVVIVVHCNHVLFGLCLCKLHAFCHLCLFYASTSGTPYVAHLCCRREQVYVGDSGILLRC